MQTTGLNGERRQRVDIPVDAEVVRRRSRSEGGDRDARVALSIRARVDDHAASLQMRRDHLSECIATQPRDEGYGSAEPSKSERNVRWAAPRVSFEGPPSALTDQVDQRFAHDDEHRH